MTVPARDDREEIYERAVALYESQNFTDALAILLSLADSEYPPAYYKLAQFEFYHRDRKNALPWLARLEEAAARNDADACFRCFHAYRMGWAQIGIEKDEQIGSDYLRRAAELGHDQAQLMLALEHRSGANGQVKDESLYLHWINKAVEAGNENAVYDLAKFLSDKGRPVPDALMVDLKIVAEDWPNAAKLYDKLTGRTSRN